MYTVYPDYYKDFKCIGSRCTHNCCIGWEIDIDDSTAAYYKTARGEIGKRLCKSVEHGEVPHFILGENDRCPFLNSDNLCDIIIELGKEHLCTICAKHPRFENQLPDRTETGVGMACEEAARLILTKKEPTALCGAKATDDEIIILRDRVIAALQNREKSISGRISDMLALCGTQMPDKSIAEWAKILLSLERLCEKWTDLVKCLKDSVDTAHFDMHMQGRENEYEQLLVYFIYRHFANAPDLENAGARACFAALAYTVIHTLGAVIFNKNGTFSVADQIELCRIFSSEIEYSDKNLYILLDEMN